MITWEFSGLPLSCSTPRRSILSLLTNTINIASLGILQIQYRASHIDKRDFWCKCNYVVLYLVNSTTSTKSGQFHFISSKTTVESWFVGFLASNYKMHAYLFLLSACSCICCWRSLLYCSFFFACTVLDSSEPSTL